MKGYLAGTTVTNPETADIIQKLFKKGNKLHSYYHCQEKGFEHSWWNMNKKNGVSLFLDSGAFSAFTQNVEINIKEYINFIKTHKDCLEVYANLDVIGSAEGTWKNQKAMEKAGLAPLPCFHFGEDIKWLQRYLKRGHKYIALGGMVGGSSKGMKKWLDKLFSEYICDKNGIPLVKVHGFGMTSLKLMLRYPWYSVDSTSWVITGRLGSIYVPRYRKGKWIYNENSWKVNVSSRSPSLKEHNKHIHTMSPAVKKTLLNYIHSKGYILGESEFKEVSLDYKLKENEKWHGTKKEAEKNGFRVIEIILEHGISNDYKLRDEMNIIYFLDLEKNMKKWPWAFDTKSVWSGLGI